MGDLHLVLPALNMSTLGTGILIMVQQVRLMMFSMKMVDYSMSFLLLSTFMLKSHWWVGWGGVVVVVASMILVQAPVLGGLRTKGLGPGLDNCKCSGDNVLNVGAYRRD